MVAGRYIGNDPEAFFPKAGEKGAIGGLHILLIAPRDKTEIKEFIGKLWGRKEVPYSHPLHSLR